MRRYKNIICKKAYRKQITALVIYLFCLCLPVFQSQTSPLPAYKIKAVFLFNFTQFVEWPDGAFNNNNDPFVIGILGKDPFGKYIDEVVQSEKVGNHSITIMRYQNISEINNCQVLFIEDNDSNLPSVLSALNNRAILTVSDMQGFTQAGGIIGFVTIENKIKLQININAAKEAGLNISSKLLSVANIVK
jgi:uncharacterized protein DUF4154